jgi:ABC-type Fe3+-hydroxamate transport system substrate-binding protein
MLALGVTPLAVNQSEHFRERIEDPRLPPQVLDLGSESEPNLELIQQLKPDLLLTSTLNPGQRQTLQRIAPVREYIWELAPGQSPYDKGLETLFEVGDWLDRRPQALAVAQQLEGRLQACRQRLNGRTWPPIFIGDLTRGKGFIRLYARNSILNDALRLIGLDNAWRGEVDEYGKTRVGIEQLANPEHALLFYLNYGKSSVRALHELSTSSLWNQLPLVRQGHVVPLPPTYVSGVQSAVNLAEAITAYLETRYV